jgi:hypothetical protein
MAKHDPILQARTLLIALLLALIVPYALGALLGMLPAGAPTWIPDMGMGLIAAFMITGLILSCLTLPRLIIAMSRKPLMPRELAYLAAALVTAAIFLLITVVSPVWWITRMRP